jgi:hypothetical protein
MHAYGAPVPGRRCLGVPARRCRVARCARSMDRDSRACVAASPNTHVGAVRASHAHYQSSDDHSSERDGALANDTFTFASVDVATQPPADIAPVPVRQHANRETRREQLHQRPSSIGRNSDRHRAATSGRTSIPSTRRQRRRDRRGLHRTGRDHAISKRAATPRWREVCSSGSRAQGD